MSVKHKLSRLGSRGDTIVEVLIVLTVLGLALSIAYSTANRSLLNARQAQENSVATELVQGQLESIRSKVANDASNPDYLYAAGLFCVDSSGHLNRGFSGSNPATYSFYPAACVNNGLYHLSIHWGGAPTDKFTVEAVWDDVLGQGQDTVTTDYRIHRTP